MKISVRSGLTISLVLVAFIGKAQNSQNGKMQAKKALIYTTAKDTEYSLSLSDSTSFKPFAQPLETDVCVFVDPGKTYQEFIGIGGALTDASAETWAKLPKDKQDELIRAYFDKDQGIGYLIGRTNINSCDFSSGSYTYVKENDSALKSFDIGHDERYKIPFIKAAYEATGQQMKLFVSPWSPPAWMKDNNNMLQGGKLKAGFRQSWANYYVKFIREYEKRNIPVWGLTVQNEPMAKQRWESCIFTAQEERDFIKNHLGPTLVQAKMGDKKLIAWDHNRDLLYHRASTILDDQEASKYVWGIGFHWYETWTGSQMQFNNLRLVKENYPDKNLIFTEGCAEKFDYKELKNWRLGEKYAHSMINDFNSGTVAWTDWNILLDERGGPNHVENFCFAPIHADTRSGELIYTNAYPYIGHFSKFIQPGAKRILSTSNRDLLETTAFQNLDGTSVIVVLNSSDQPLKFRLSMNSYAAEMQSRAHSIQTILLK